MFIGTPCIPWDTPRQDTVVKNWLRVCKLNLRPENSYYLLFYEMFPHLKLFSCFSIIYIYCITSLFHFHSFSTLHFTLLHFQRNRVFAMNLVFFSPYICVLCNKFCSLYIQGYQRSHPFWVTLYILYQNLDYSIKNSQHVAKILWKENFSLWKTLL